ncbi:MAG TPA: TM2 domain-containing protein [Bdellovibrionota bacterium]|nr:TM2 domain-containing protein [Bdellovibrionota bacterium]
MKKSLITGSWLLLVSGVLVLAWSVTLGFGGREAGRFSLPFDNTTHETRVVVDTDRHVQVVVEANIAGQSVQEKEKTAAKKNEKEYQLRYKFPFQYSVEDLSGQKIQSETTDIGWDSGSRTLYGANVDVTGGSLQHKSSFKKFKSGAKELVVKASAGPDTTYSANATNGSVIIRDQIYEYGLLTGLGILLLIGGWVVNRVGNAYQAPVSPKKRLVAFVLCFLIGFFGVHRFYVGKIGTGILMIVTLGGFCLWYISDVITILAGAFLDKEGKRLTEWT